MKLLLCLKPWLLVLLLKWELEIVGCADDDPNEHTNPTDPTNLLGANPTSSSDQEGSHNESQNSSLTSSQQPRGNNSGGNSSDFQLVVDLDSREFEFLTFENTLVHTDTSSIKDSSPNQINGNQDSQSEHLTSTPSSASDGTTPIDLTQESSKNLNKVIISGMGSGSKDIAFRFFNDGTISYVAKGYCAFNNILSVQNSSGSSSSESEIWKAITNSNLANKIVMDGMLPNKSLENVTVYLKDGTIKNFNKSDGKWSEKSSIDLNIKVKTSTYQFDFKKDSSANIGTYTTKHGFMFNSVKNNNQQVWNSENDLYANKVLMDGINNETYTNNVTVYLKDGTIKNFYYSSNSWYERTSPLQLDISKKNSVYQFDYSNDKTSNTDTYTSKYGLNFGLVKQGNTEIWKTTDDSEHSTKVEVKTDGSKPKFITVYLNDNTTKCFIKLGDNWFETPVSVEVDIKKSSNTDSFNVNKDNKVNTYTPKDGIRFNGVKQGNTEIWKANGDSEHSLKVVFQDLGSNKADLTVYLNDGSTKKFHRTGKNDPWTDPDSGQDEEQASQQYNDSTAESSEDSKSTPTSGSSTPETKPESESGQSEGSSQDSSESKSMKPSSSTPSTPSATSIPKAGQGSQDTKTTPDPVFQPSATPSTPATPPEHPDKLKIFTDGSSSENDNTKYDLKKHGDIYKFTFNDGVKCKQIKYNDKEIWKFDASMTKILKEFYLNNSTRMCYYSYSKTKYVPRYSDDEWKADSGTDKKLSDSKFKVLTQGSDGSTKENETTHYDETNDGSFVKCEFKDNARCVELKHENKEAYKHDQTQHGTNYPKCLYFHKHLMVVFVIFDDDTFVFVWFDSDTESWRYVKFEKFSSFDPNKLDILTPDPSDANKDKENDTNVFDKKLMGPVVGFIIKEVPNFFKARYDQEIVFTFRKGHTKQPALKEIYFMGHSKKVLLWLEDKCYYANYEEFESVS